MGFKEKVVATLLILSTLNECLAEGQKTPNAPERKPSAEEQQQKPQQMPRFLGNQGHGGFERFSDSWPGDAMTEPQKENLPEGK